VAAMLLSVTMPICGWMVSLSNRVAVLEEKTASLATAAQMAEVKQKIDDWIELNNRLRLDDQARAAREGK
jgi:regulator of replication initiation timing